MSIALVHFLAALAAPPCLLLLPRLLRAPRPGKALPYLPRSFPRGFLWGSGEDAYQHEGGNVHADWYDWERTEPPPLVGGCVAGSCADFWNRWEEDFALAKADGQTSHRIGLEWSRLEPEAGHYDEEAWACYRAMLESLKSKGFVTFLNLWHITLPRWAAARGGWLDGEVLGRWQAFAAEAARRLGDLVDYWSTMIDAQVYAILGYMTGDFPPLEKDTGKGIEVYARLVEAHAAARRAIKGACRSPSGGEPLVGQIYFFTLFESAGGPLDNLVLGVVDSVFNRAIPDAMWTGRLRLSIPGVPRMDRSEEGWKGSLDWLGINYYYREVLSFAPGQPAFTRRAPGPGPGRTDMGWEIYPEGLGRLCRTLARRYPGLPLFITENGLADADDSRRPRFILDHVAEVGRLLDEGIPIRGYAHWSLTDNLEWVNGFGPKFGLYRVDRATMERKPTLSARLFAFIARENRLPTEGELVGLGLSRQ